MNPYRTSAAPVPLRGPGAWEKVKSKFVAVSRAFIIALVVAAVVPLRFLMGLDPLGF